MESIARIKVGKTYETRSICDHECIYRATILKRTAKRATIKTNQGVKVVGIFVYEGREQFRPYGSYSMAPVMGE